MAIHHPRLQPAATPASAPASGQYGQYGAPSAPRQTLRPATTTKPALDSAAFLARCTVLAHANHRDASEAVYAGQHTRSGAIHYRVASSSAAGRLYQVSYTPAAQTWRCNCPAGSTHHPCKHTGVAYAAFTMSPPAPTPSAREQVRAGMERELRQRIATLRRQASDMDDNIASMMRTWGALFDGGVSDERLARLDADIDRYTAQRRAVITRLQSDRAQLAALVIVTDAPLALV